MRKAWLVIPLLVMAVFPSHAQESHSVPYKEYFDQMTRFYKQKSERLILRLSVQPVKESQPLVLPIKMSVAVAGTVADVPVDANNAVELGFHPEWVDQGAEVTINQTRETYVMRAQIGMKLTPGSTSIPYNDVQKAFDEFNALVEKEAGVVSFLAPSAKTLRIICGTDCVASLGAAPNARQFTPDDKGRINIPNDKGLAKQFPVITTNKPILYTVLTTKG